METLVTEHDGRLLARIEDDRMVFEVNFDTLVATDVTLRFRRDGEEVGSVYNDFGTEKTMARLATAGDGDGDFLGVEVPKSFVARVVEVASDVGRVEDAAALEGYQLRMLSDPTDE
jgi:hypothetical protein